MDKDNNQEIIEGIALLCQRISNIIKSCLLLNIQKILLEHFFGCFLGRDKLYQENKRKSAAKVFFGCLVAARFGLYSIFFDIGEQYLQ